MASTQGPRPSKKSLGPRQLYVSYLSTDAIADCMADINGRLIDRQLTLAPQTRESYRMILRDLELELEGRQLGLWE